MILCVLNGFFWRLSGAGVKPFGICYPIMAGIYGLIHGSWWQGILIGLAAWGTTTLPITLFGDSVTNNFPWGFLWVWLLGYIYGLPSVLLHGWPGFYYALIPCLAFGLGTTLSNIKTTSKIFVWEFVEGITGCSVILALIGSL